MMVKRNVFFFSVFLTTLLSYAQSQDSFLNHIKELCSTKMHGRGAEFGGDGIAAKYISNHYKKNGLKPYRGSYYQNFNYAVNTFEGTYTLTINNKT